MLSVWSDSVDLKKFPKLEKDTKTDVLIIGGGIAGILLAYFLKEKGIDYILVEGRKITDGATKNTTAKITAQHGLIYNRLINEVGLEKAKQYLDANLWAVEKYKELCKNIDCDFKEETSFVYSLRDKKKIEDECVAINKLGFKSQLVDNIPLPLQIVGAVDFQRQAQFNPLKFIKVISENLNIYENTFVREIDGNIAITKDGIKIKANKIIMATHFPFINTKGLYFVKMYQSRSYVIAVDNAPEVHGMYIDEAENGLSFRNYKNLLLVGGGDHRTGKPGGKWEELRNFVGTYYKDAVEKYDWATQDCMTLDGIPYIGKYSSNNNDLLVATGFNKWGMTSSMVSAYILSDMIMGKKNRFSEVFSPQRSIMKKQLFVNLGETASNFFSPKIKRCSHLGCALKWNKEERTWDCSCHGSRFSKDGKIIDNPAKKDLK